MNKLGIQLPVMDIGGTAIFVLKFLAMRHGERAVDAQGNKLDILTDLGANQMLASTRIHLAEREFIRVMHTGTKRTHQGMFRVIEAIQPLQEGRIISSHPEMGYEWLHKDSGVPEFEYPNFDGLTVYEALQACPQCLAFRVRNTQMMCELAIQHAGWALDGLTNGHYVSAGDGVPYQEALIITHQAVGEMAVPHTRDFPILGHADICEYEIRVNSDPGGKFFASIFEAKHLPCPTVE